VANHSAKLQLLQFGSLILLTEVELHALPLALLLLIHGALNLTLKTTGVSVYRLSQESRRNVERTLHNALLQLKSMLLLGVHGPPNL
jgi:hypothetical protein